MYLPDYVKKAISIMKENGYHIYPVGGCVRSSIIGSTPNDFDMTTNATPDQILEAFKEFKTFTQGIKHGTISVIIDGHILEITTYRIESRYADNRHPDSVIFANDLSLDLCRRDFTMNSIAYDLSNNSYIDMFGGISDIENRCIRTVGNAQERFKEDSLRILRALRFSSVLGFKIERKTAEAIHANKDLLLCISKERIFDEFTKLLCGNNVKNVLLEFYDVIGVFIPEILPCVNFDQRNIHHCYDVFTHTAVSVENIRPEPLLRWVMFLHDIGKPDSFSIDENGGHFYGHYRNSSKYSEKILKRLRASNDFIESTSLLVYRHDSTIPVTEKSVRRLLMKIGPRNVKLLFEINRADAKAQAPYQLKERLERIDRLEAIATRIISENECFSKNKMMINGTDLINLGIEPGPQIGKILDTLLCEIVDGELENTNSALIKRAEELK